LTKHITRGNIWYKISCEEIITKFKPLINDETNTNIKNTKVEKAQKEKKKTEK
jgi:uncharacterized ferritin-like protein (DUF455 family)